MQAKTFVELLIHINLKFIEYGFEGETYYKGVRIKIEENIPFGQVIMVDKKDMILNNFSVCQLYESC